MLHQSTTQACSRAAASRTSASVRMVRAQAQPRTQRVSQPVEQASDAPMDRRSFLAASALVTGISAALLAPAAAPAFDLFKNPLQVTKAGPDSPPPPGAPTAPLGAPVTPGTPGAAASVSEVLADSIPDIPNAPEETPFDVIEFKGKLETEAAREADAEVEAECAARNANCKGKRK